LAGTVDLPQGSATTTMNRVPIAAIEERRQLITFALAVLVFLMTLFAMHLRDSGSTPGRAGIADRAPASHAMREGGITITGGGAVTLTAATSIGSR
jgi:hypothetical protein